MHGLQLSPNYELDYPVTEANFPFIVKVIHNNLNVRTLLQFGTYLSVISIIIQHNLKILSIPFLFVNDITNLDI